MTNKEKHRFYESAAKRFKAELKLYGATAAVHLENKNDELFWSKVLHRVYPDKKFRFIASSRSHTGNDTCGCTQCLQYLDFLDEKFWIAIDSDYRYLGEEPYMNPCNFVLQTYTYSFENHFCFGPNMNRALEQAMYPIQPDFDFDEFLKEYSYAIYPIMVWQLYLENIDKEAFPKSVFHRMLDVKLPPLFWDKNGDAVVDISGRPFIVFNAEFVSDKCGEMDTQLFEEFMRSFAYNGGFTLHISCPYGTNDHHKAEAMFKSLARALRQAASIDERFKDQGI